MRFLAAMLLAALATPALADDGVGGFAGIQVGPMISLNGLGPTVLPRLEAGVTLPPMDGAWRIYASAQGTRAVGSGTGESDQVPGGTYEWELMQDQLVFGLGPMFRATMLDGPVVPEAAVGPTLSLNRSIVNGSADGEPFPEQREQYTRVGVYAAAGVAFLVGPGELTLLATLASSGLNGVVTGPSTNSLSLTPTLGYRLVF